MYPGCTDHTPNSGVQRTRTSTAGVVIIWTW